VGEVFCKNKGDCPFKSREKVNIRGARKKVYFCYWKFYCTLQAFSPSDASKEVGPVVNREETTFLIPVEVEKLRKVTPRENPPKKVKNRTLLPRYAKKRQLFCSKPNGDCPYLSLGHYHKKKYCCYDGRCSLQRHYW